MFVGFFSHRAWFQGGRRAKKRERVEELSLFDEAQAEVLHLMMRDSWVRYLQSVQFVDYARDHMKNAPHFR